MSDDPFSALLQEASADGSYHDQVPDQPEPTERELAARRRRVFRRRRSAVFGTLGIIVLGALYSVSALLAPLPIAAAATPAASTISQSVAAPTWPSWGAGAVGATGYDSLLAQTGSTESAPIASMTKTITALVLLDKKPIAAGSSGPTITFGDKDVQILDQVLAEDGSWATVKAGEKLTEKQALTAMLLPSANNYAISLANWAFGSTDTFLTAANSWLAKHGFTHTHVTDPSGLDAGSVSSTTDLVGIGKLVIANPVLSTIVSTRSATLPDIGTLDNGNKLLGTDGIDGIKTGWTDEAGHCLLFAAKSTIGGKNVDIVGVVVGASSYDDLWKAVPPLLASIKNGFHSVSLGTTKDGYGDYATAWGGKATLVAQKPSKLFVWSDTPIHVTVRSRPVQVANPGDDLGTVTFSSGSQKIEKTLTVRKAVGDPGFWWRVTHPIDLFF